MTENTSPPYEPFDQATIAEYSGTAFQAGLAGDWPLAQMTVQELGTRHGGDAVAAAALAWIDEALAASTGGRRPAPHVKVEFLNVDTGQVGGEVKPEVVWASRLATARLADDEAGFGAVLDELPDDPAAVGRHFGAVLTCTVLTVKHAAEVRACTAELRSGR